MGTASNIKIDLKKYCFKNLSFMKAAGKFLNPVRMKRLKMQFISQYVPWLQCKPNHLFTHLEDTTRRHDCALITGLRF